MRRTVVRLKLNRILVQLNGTITVDCLPRIEESPMVGKCIHELPVASPTPRSGLKPQVPFDYVERQIIYQS